MKDKKYYWIKLKTDFFSREEIDFLLSERNGCQYIVLYEMLCLSTANSNGEMVKKIGDVFIPYCVEKIVRDTKYFDFDTVTIALEMFKKLGLIYEKENNIFRITNFEEMVGSEGASASRVREFRAKKKALQCNNNVTQEIEIENKILDIRNKEKKDIKNNIQCHLNFDKKTKSCKNCYKRNLCILPEDETYSEKEMTLEDNYWNGKPITFVSASTEEQLEMQKALEEMQIKSQ